MFFSRLWMILLAAAAVFAFCLALVAPKPLVREVSRSCAEKLDQSQHNAELTLRLEARDWIDTVAKMAQDRSLVDSLEEATDNPSDINLTKSRVQTRLLALVSLLPSETRPQLMIALDARGRHVFRQGPGEERYEAGKHGISGFPLVEAALRGLRRDDTWNVDGKLFLVVGSPAISRAKGRYVGALVLGQEINDAFAQRLKAHLDRTDLAFFLRGKLVGSTVKFRELEKLPSRYVDPERRKERDSRGRTATILVGQGPEARYAIMTPLPGEAAEHDAFYTVLRPPVPAMGPFQVLQEVDAADLAFDELPWLLIGGGFVVALVVGMLLLMWEAGLPLRRLEVLLRKLASGEATGVEPERFSGRFLRMVRDINKGLERAHKQVQQAEAAPSLSRSPFAVGPEPPFHELPEPVPLAGRGPGPEADMPPLAQAGGGRAVRVEAEPVVWGPPVPEYEGSSLDPAAEGPGPLTRAAPELGPGVRPLVGLDAGEADADIESFPPPREDEDLSAWDTVVDPPEEEPPPAAVRPLKRLAPETRPTGRAAASFDMEPDLIPGARDSVEMVPRRQIRIPESELAPFPPPSASQGSEAEADTVMSSVPEQMARSMEEQAAPGSEEVELEQEMRQIYKEFVTVKRQCGEDVSSLSFERFAAKLKKNRDGLIERFACRTVRFQVYVKEGKAALKATPVKD